jgi:serine/threonine protein kinase
MMRTPGSRFGPYEIVTLLGKGAMGEVHRARDTRLMRDVALKVLPDSLLHHRVALERFEREARSASALNHPNVVTVYEIGEIDGTPYMAMGRCRSARRSTSPHRSSTRWPRRMRVASCTATSSPRTS